MFFGNNAEAHKKNKRTKVLPEVTDIILELQLIDLICRKISTAKLVASAKRISEVG
jgi:hypothetical protein